MAKTEIRAEASLDTTKFQRGLAKSQKGISKFTSNAIKQFGAMAAAFAASAGIKRASSFVKEMENASRISGEGTEEFQRFAFAAKTVGVEMQKSADILKDVKDKVGDFLATGAGPMADFFENIAPKVGVTAEQFRNLSGKQALQLYVSSLEKANVSSNEMTFYMEAIASDAAALIPLLADNGRELDNLANKADKLGAVIDERTSKSIKQMSDSIEQTESAFISWGAKAFVAGQGVFEALFTVGQAAINTKVSVEDLLPPIEGVLDSYDPLKDKALQAAKAQHALAMATDMSTQFLYDQVDALDTLEERLDKQAAKEEEIANKKFINAKKLEELQLRSEGRHVEADALKKQIELTEKAMRIAKQYGVSLAEAAKIVQGIEKNKPKEEESKDSTKDAADTSATSSSAGGTSAKGKAKSAIKRLDPNSFRARELAAGLYNTTLGRDGKSMDAKLAAAASAGKPQGENPATVQKSMAENLDTIAKELTTTTR